MMHNAPFGRTTKIWFEGGVKTITRESQPGERKLFTKGRE